MNEITLNLKHCNALDLLSNIEDKSIDLILTDPPFYISKESGFSEGKLKKFKSKNINFGDWDDPDSISFTWFDSIIKEYYRVLRKGGTLIMFCDLWKISHFKILFEKQKFKQLRFIEWIKTNPVPINQRVNYLSNAREVAVLGVKVGKPIFNSKYDNGIYKYPIPQKNRIHPNQKPLGLLEELIKKHSNEDSTVLDTFAGSGSTLIAAYNLNRNSIGCENNDEFYSKAQKLIDKV